jgi:hypothetical protein
VFRGDLCVAEEEEDPDNVGLCPLGMPFELILEPFRPCTFFNSAAVLAEPVLVVFEPIPLEMTELGVCCGGQFGVLDDNVGLPMINGEGDMGEVVSEGKPSSGFVETAPRTALASCRNPFIESKVLLPWELAVKRKCFRPSPHVLVSCFHHHRPCESHFCLYSNNECGHRNTV